MTVLLSASCVGSLVLVVVVFSVPCLCFDTDDSYDWSEDAMRNQPVLNMYAESRVLIRDYTRCIFVVLLVPGI